MRRFVRDNGLLLVALWLFLALWAAQVLTGQHSYNADRGDHGASTVALIDYVRSGHFIEATFENWESEFLQMGSYVLLTVWLRQRGSAESKPLDEATELDDDPARHRHDQDAPWPVRHGGLAARLYSHSLSAAFFSLFALSWFLHAVGGAHELSEEQLAHGGHAVTTWAFVHTPEFWFQSFQNWQSEFLAVAAIVGLSIYLRERGSPESKPVHAPHGTTGA